MASLLLERYLPWGSAEAGDIFTVDDAVVSRCKRNKCTECDEQPVFCWISLLI